MKSFFSIRIFRATAVCLLLLSVLVSAGCSRTGESDAVRVGDETKVEESVAGSGKLVPLNGTDLFVREMGQGETILVIHGGPVLEHGYLLPHLNKLAETNRLILFDQRLSGRSSADVPVEDVTFEKFLGDIDAVRVYAGEESVHVMGHSWGGLLAMMYATTFPEQTRSLILVSPMPASWNDWQEESMRLASLALEQDAIDRERVMQSEAFAQQEISAFEELYEISFRGQFHDRSKVDQLTFYIPPDLNERSRRFGALMPQFQDYNLYESLATISAPTLVMYGAAEPAASMSGLKIRDAIDGAVFSIIPDAGHFSFVEAPDEFNDVLQQFLGMGMTR